MICPSRTQPSGRESEMKLAELFWLAVDVAIWAHVAVQVV